MLPPFWMRPGLRNLIIWLAIHCFPLLSGKIPAKWRRDIYYHYYDYPAQHKVRRHDGVRDSRYKLIHFMVQRKIHWIAMSCMT